MSRFISTLGIIVSILLVLQYCSSGGHSSSPEKIDRIIDSQSDSKSKVWQQIVATFTSIASNNNNADSQVFSDVPTYADRQESQRLTDTAKILAGMNISDRSTLANLETVKSWQQHQDFLNSAWLRLETQRLVPMRDWQATELNSLETAETTIFYPFSNGNFLDVYTLFPQGKLFILVGIEPVGSIPFLSQLSAPEIAEELKYISGNLYEILSLDYFRPPHPLDSLDREAVAALSVFLVRTNNRIYHIEYVSLDREAKIRSPQPGTVSGVKIVFASEGDTERRILYYFSSELSNQALTESPELATFIGRHDRQITYLDAAAYLMHYDSFSQIKELILAQSKYILQDDSGLPLTAFKPNRWDLSFYGDYTQPIVRFGDRYQPQLWQTYSSENNIQPLSFATGYRLKAEDSNLMLARNKGFIGTR